MTETLCDTMLSKHQTEDAKPTTPTPVEDTVATPVAEVTPTKESSHNPVPYDAKGKRNFI